MRSAAPTLLAMGLIILEVQGLATSWTSFSSDASFERVSALVGGETALQLRRYAELLGEWNAKINVISRKDTEDILGRHLLPCVAVPLAARFQEGETCLDAGTGGGLPGLVSAICAPQAHFTLLDGRGKKILVVSEIAKELGLDNVTPVHARVEDVKEKFDFVTGRSVAALPKFVPLVRKNVRGGLTGKDAVAERPFGPGIVYIKGGEIAEEVRELGFGPSLWEPLDAFIPDYDGDKRLLHFPSAASGAGFVEL